MSDVDELLRQCLMEVVMGTALIPPEQRKLIVQELARVDMKDQQVKEQLKQSFGQQAYEQAFKTAQAKASAAAADPGLLRDKHLPKALCQGGDVAALSGVDISKERELLDAIKRSTRNGATAGSLVSPETPGGMIPVTPDGAVAISRFVNAAIGRVLKEASAANTAMRKAQESTEEKLSSVHSHPALQKNTRNLRSWGLRALLSAVEIGETPLSSLWEERVLLKIQERILTG